MKDIIIPMEPVPSDKIVENENWIHQIKWDGIRGISYIENKDLSLYTKSGYERTGTYPEVQELLKIFKGKQAVIDGELVVFNNEEKPSFQLILNRDRAKNRIKINHYLRTHPVKYILFDILYLDGKDLRNCPLSERLGLLDYNIEISGEISVNKSFTDGEGLFKLMKDMNYEGIVSKNKSSPYVPGKKHDYWYKIKIKRKILAVMAGLNIENDMPKSIILGIYLDDSLKYIGSASLGLKNDDLYILKDTQKTMVTEINPFNEDISIKNALWLEPKVTLWVEFFEWTNDGILRHPKIVGFSDMDPKEACGKEYMI